jgi:hypothetical protein
MGSNYIGDKNNLLLATKSKGIAAWRFSASWCKQSILLTNGIVIKKI